MGPRRVLGTKNSRANSGMIIIFHRFFTRVSGEDCMVYKVGQGGYSTMEIRVRKATEAHGRPLSG